MKGGSSLITLDSLKVMGSISTDYELIDYHGTKSVSVSEILSWSMKKRAQFDGVVICDNCSWAATLKKIPLIKASKVYTSNGESLCCWDSKKRILFIINLVDNKLVTTKQIQMPAMANNKNNKEDKKMAAIDLNGLNELTGDLKEMDLDGMGETPAVEATSTERAQSKLNRAFIEKMKAQNIDVADNAAVAIEAQRRGRALGFIVKTDKVVRMGLAKVPVLDGNHVILNELGEKDSVIKQQYNDYIAGRENSRKPANKYLVTKYEYKFREAKPGKIVGMILSIPANILDINLASLVSTGVDLNASAGSELVTRILPIEAAYQYLISVFDGKIKEDEAILGSRATYLQIKAVVTAPKEGSASISSENLRFSLVLTEKNETRKTLLTTGNYVPAKVYKTLSQADITSAEASALLNHNVEQLFSKGDKFAQLAEADAKITSNEGTTVDYFDVSSSKRIAIPAIKSFDTGVDIANPRVAVRDKKIAAKSGNITFPFMFEESFDSVLALPATKKIMERANLSAEDLQKSVTEMVKTKSTTKTSKNINSIDINTLKAYNKSKGTQSIKDLAALLSAAGN